MKLYLCNYSDANYRANQEKHTALIRELNIFDEIIPYNREWLVTTEFYKENQFLLDMERGGGYWVWKPYIILETLKKAQPEDIIFYLDSGDMIYDPDTIFKEYVLRRIKNTDILLRTGGFPHYEWTKRDCFILMGCDEEKYWNNIQLEAGTIIVKNTEFATNIISEWLSYCKIPDIITDSANKLGENFDGFKEHRHDQSILTNIKVKYNLKEDYLIRRYITCNVEL